MDVSPDAVGALAGRLADRTEVATAALDVTADDAARRAFDAGVERFGRVDALVNNAGVEGPVAPLEDLDATLMQVTVPAESRLAGVEVAELRLPPGAGVSLVLRAGEIFVPGPTTVLRAGDHLLVAAAREHRPTVERRLRAVSDSGRLAGWYAALPGGGTP